MLLDHSVGFCFCLLVFIISLRICSKWGICLGNKEKIIMSNSAKLKVAKVREESTCFSAL